MSPTHLQVPPTDDGARSRSAAVLFVAVAIVVLCVLALASPAHALEQDINLTGKNFFGVSVAVQGDTLVVGAPFEADATGAAYVYRRSGDSWAQAARLTASDGGKGQLFGEKVAIDGDTIVVGAPAATVGMNVAQGAAYTFAATGAPDRTQTAKLAASDGAKGSSFGSAVAIDGDTIAVGALLANVGQNIGQGAVYTFATDGAPARTETAELTASDGAGDDTLGASVAIDGDTIVAGAPFATIGTNDLAGAAYTFGRSGAAARNETAKLTASNGAKAARLGQSVAIDGDTIVSGAFNQPVGTAATGAAYTFARTGAKARTENATLTASDGAAGDAFGLDTALDGDRIVAGAPGANGMAGAAYTFARAGATQRTQTGKLADANGKAMDFFGFSVAVDRETIVVGAPQRDSVSVFFAPTPPVTEASPPGTDASPAGSAPEPQPGAAAARPALSKLAVTPKTIRRHPSRARKAAKHARITFTLSSAATVELRFDRCRKKRCNHKAGRVTVHGKAGRNTVPFTGKLSRHRALAAGSYRLTATPSDGAGQAGTARATTLTVVGR